MTTAPASRTHGRRFVLHPVSWKQYEGLLREFGDRHLFLTYYRGTLEFMSPSFPHDRYSRLIFMLVRVMAEELNVPIISAGTTTFRRKSLKVGIEADEAFYTTHERSMRGLKEVDLAIDPPPDLAIEVEVSRRMGKRTAIYARLGIPEVWSFNGEKLKVQVLGSNKRYTVVDCSPTFPRVPLATVNAFILNGVSSEENEWLKSFRALIKNLPSA